MIRSKEHTDRVLMTDGHKIWTQDVHDDSNHDSRQLWQLEPAHRNQFYISSKVTKKCISCTPERTLFTTPNRKSWEEWVVEFAQPGSVAIKSYVHHGEARYLAPRNEHDDTLVMGNEMYLWTIEQSPHGGVNLCSSSKNMLLACDPNGDGIILVVSTNPPDGGDSNDITSWLFEPRMPQTISAKQIYGMTGAGILGLSMIVAAPFAVVGAIGALGFGAEGIVAGSVAASMMSAEAIAAGTGGVVAGGTVATLPSIGAAGLGIVGTTAAMTGGTVVGASIVGITGAVVSNTSNNSHHCGGEDIVEDAIQYRPFAGWRDW